MYDFTSYKTVLLSSLFTVYFSAVTARAAAKQFNSSLILVGICSFCSVAELEDTIFFFQSRIETLISKKILLSASKKSKKKSAQTLQVFWRKLECNTALTISFFKL